jgi:carbon storage regulator
MLVLSRKPGERILIGPHIELTIVHVRGGRVKLGFECPANVRVLREELQSVPRQVNRMVSVHKSSFYPECA